VAGAQAHFINKRTEYATGTTMAEALALLWPKLNEAEN